MILAIRLNSVSLWARRFHPPIAGSAIHFNSTQTVSLGFPQHSFCAVPFPATTDQAETITPEKDSPQGGEAPWQIGLAEYPKRVQFAIGRPDLACKVQQLRTT
jgi:hypothetical protein